MSRLTRGETLRQVLIRLYPETMKRLQAFMRRNIRREIHTEDFPNRLAQTRDVIDRALSRLSDMRSTFGKADEEYLHSRAPASIDLIMQVVYEEYDGVLGPPVVRRTKTPVFQTRSDTDFEVGSWEVVDVAS